MQAEGGLGQLRELTAKIDQLEPDLAERGRMFSMLFERVPKAIVIANRDTFEYVSSHFAACLGRAQADLCSRPWVDFVHPEDLAPTVTVRDGVMEDGQPAIGFQNRYRHFDGHWVKLEWHAAAWEDGYTFGWVEVIDAE